MAKASTIIRSFNGGEWSPLVEGRVDLEKYPSSLRQSLNGILTPQGAWVGRSGTMLVQTAASENVPSTLIPFVHSVDQSLILEFTDFALLFLDEDGVVASSITAPTNVSWNAGTRQLLLAGAGLNTGDWAVITGAPASTNLNGLRLRASGPNILTLPAATFPPASAAGISVAKCYAISTPYSAAEAATLRYVSQLDEIRLLSPTRQPMTLQRYGATDWRLSPIKFKNGPFLKVNATGTRLTPNRTGAITPKMAGYTAVGLEGESVSVTNQASFPGHVAWQAFDQDITSDFAAYPTTDDNGTATGVPGAFPAQNGQLEIFFSIPKTVTGYAFNIPTSTEKKDYTIKDQAPLTFALYGASGVGAYELIDQQSGYVLYDNYCSEYFPLKAPAIYTSYKLVVTALQRNGNINPRIADFRLIGPTSRVTFTASSVVGINGDAGFAATDVGRALSFKGADGRTRSFNIVTVLDGVNVVTVPVGDALPDVSATTEWRLGYWSDTTGWPTCGTFFQDRLWYGGGSQYPNLLAGSFVGDYDNFLQTSPTGVLNDDNAFVGQLNARKVPAIAWISADQRGLLIGTSSGEWAVPVADGAAISAKTAQARNATARGCANIEPVRVDAQVLYIQKAQKTIREFTYQFQTDGYRSPSMSLFAAHLGAQPFLQVEYAAEPNSIMWVRRADGQVKGLTYNREEDVIGWHSHDFSGMFVESIAVKPAQNGTHDVLWISGRRTVGGVTRRFIERLVKAWDFDQQADPRNAFYVDNGLRYAGAPTATLYGLSHLEGEVVYALADGSPTGALTVANGSVTLGYEASVIAVGRGFDAAFSTARLEGGAADGTAQGKTKRITNMGFRMWQSCEFLFGVDGAEPAEATLRDGFEQIGSPLPLFTGDTGPLAPEGRYETTGSITLKRDKGVPLPFNVVAIMPQFLTQDR